jgi:hypothetical protein
MFARIFGLRFRRQSQPSPMHRMRSTGPLLILTWAITA